MVALSQTLIGDIFYNLKNDDKTAEVTHVSYANDYAGSVVIPSKVKYKGIEYNVTSIGKRAFYICKDLTSVTIPNSVKSIGDAAFKECYNLKTINIPNSVERIGTSAFEKCESLTSITLPNIRIIEERTFEDCKNLTSITLPKSVVKVGYMAFYGSMINTVTILYDYLRLEGNAFYNTDIKKIYVPKGRLKYYKDLGFPPYCNELFEEIDTSLIENKNDNKMKDKEVSSKTPSSKTSSPNNVPSLMSAKGGEVKKKNTLEDYAEQAVKGDKTAQEYVLKHQNEVLQSQEALRIIAMAYVPSKCDFSKGWDNYCCYAAALMGNDKACVELADNGMIDSDLDTAIGLYEFAAKANNLDAMHKLGKIYLDQTLGRRDLEKGIYWYTKAADGGHSQAKRELGTFYKYGLNVKKNQKLAKQYLGRDYDD